MAERPSDSRQTPGRNENALKKPTMQRSDPNQIDIEQLAEKVYRLMCQDVRLERARRGWD